MGYAGAILLKRRTCTSASTVPSARITVQICYSLLLLNLEFCIDLIICSRRFLGLMASSLNMDQIGRFD